MSLSSLRQLSRHTGIYQWFRLRYLLISVQFCFSIGILTRGSCDVLLEMLRKRSVVRSLVIEVRTYAVERSQER